MRRASVVVVAFGAALGASGAPLTTNAEAIEPFLRAGLTRRVDMVCLGDSNQLLGGHGWDDGWSRALSLRYGMYATGLLSAGDHAGSSSGMGYGYQSFATAWTQEFGYTGAPSYYDNYLNRGSSGMGPHAYLHVSADRQVDCNFNLGMIIDSACPLNVNGELRFSCWYGTWVHEGATFTPRVRMQTDPFSELVVGETVSSAAPTPGVSVNRLTLPAGDRRVPLNYRFTGWGEAIRGPFIMYYLRGENMGRDRGASLHTLYGVGGQSARDMAEALQLARDEYLTLYFGRVRELQTGPKRVLVRINSGLNDRGEEQPSVGPAALSPGWGPAAFADNLQAIIDRIGAIWALNKWDPTELHFLISVSHPTGDSGEWLLDLYREFAERVARANPRCAALRLSVLTSVQEMTANGWYTHPADHNHLSQVGYEALSQRALSALRPAAAWADLNDNGVVDFGDLASVLGSFGRRDVGPDPPTTRGGDVDGDGDVDFADLSAVLSNYGVAH